MTEQDIFAVFAISIITNFALSRLRAERPKTALLEAKVNFLYAKTGLVFDPWEALAPDIRKAVQNGQKIVAIKLYRDASGCGLRQAKDAVEAVMRGDGVSKAQRGPRA
jgi:ribosomal protein L7/L12